MVVKVSMLLELNDDNPKALDEISEITHHIDWLIDFDSWDDVIYNAKDVNVEIIDDTKEEKYGS